MVLYSHSRISTFLQCPYRFKLKYIDKVKPEVEQTVEAFMGSMVHETLEKLYKDAGFHKIPSKQELLMYYNAVWAKNWSDSIKIVRDGYSAANYRMMGEKYISDYYKRHYPFDKTKTVGLEQRVMIDLDGNGKYKLQGYIDRLAYLGDGKYEIHDYKTSSSLPLREYLREDRQLALYALAVLKSYPNAKDAKLVWHFLKFDEDIVIQKTKEELDELRKSVISDIERIEKAKDYSTCVSSLCDWCEFREMCPEHAHVAKTEKLSVKDFLKDSGVTLVNKYAELSEKKAAIENEMDDVKERIFAFAKENGVSVVAGSGHNAKIWSAEKLRFPGKNDDGRQALEDFLRKAGVWDDVSTVDAFELSKLMDNPPWPEEIAKAVEKFGRRELIERLYLRKTDGENHK